MNFQKLFNDITTKLDEKKVVTEDANDLEAVIIDLFESQGKITKSDLNNIASEMNISVELLEQTINDILSSFLHAGLYHASEDVEIDQKQLEMGIEVEMEHTTNRYLAQRIAQDHLVELPDYYTRLAKMEDEGEAEIE